MVVVLVVVVVVAAAATAAVAAVVKTSCVNHSWQVDNCYRLSWNPEFLFLLHYRRRQDISIRQQYCLSGLYYVTCQNTPFITVTTAKFSPSHNFTIIKEVKSLTSSVHSTPTNNIFLSTIQFCYYMLSRPTYSKLNISFNFFNYNLRFLTFRHRASCI